MKMLVSSAQLGRSSYYKARIGEILFLLAFLAFPISQKFPLFGGHAGISELCLLGSAIALGPRNYARLLNNILRNPVAPTAFIVFFTMFIIGLLQVNGMHGVFQSLAFAFYTLFSIPLVVTYVHVNKVLWKILIGYLILHSLLLLFSALFGQNQFAWDEGAGRYASLIFGVGSGYLITIGITYFLLSGLINRRIISWLMLVLMVFAIYMDKSRMAILLLAVLAIYVSILYMLFQRPIYDILLYLQKMASIGFLFLSILIAVGILAGSESYRGDFLRGIINVEDIDSVRMSGYIAALEKIIHNPFIGGGLGNTRDDDSGQGVHNAYLQLSADISLIAGIAFFIMILCALLRSWWYVRNQISSQASNEKLVISGTMCYAVLSIALHKIFHPLGLVFTDWMFFMAAAPAFYYGRRIVIDNNDRYYCRNPHV